MLARRARRASAVGDVLDRDAGQIAGLGEVLVGDQDHLAAGGACAGQQRHRDIVGRIDDAGELCALAGEVAAGLRHDRGAFGVARSVVGGEDAEDGVGVGRHQRPRLRLPRMPRTMARPSCVAMLRAADFIAASATVSPREVRLAGGGPAPVVVRAIVLVVGGRDGASAACSSACLAVLGLGLLSWPSWSALRRRTRDPRPCRRSRPPATPPSPPCAPPA